MRGFILLMLALVPSLPAYAHHSRAAFLINETTEIEGTVTEIAWKSPHIYVVVEARTEAGATELWTP